MIAIVVTDPQETLKTEVLYNVYRTHGLGFEVTSPIPSYPFLCIPHPHSIFLLPSPEFITAIEWFSPQATDFTYIPENTSNLVGTPISSFDSNCLSSQSIIHFIFYNSS